MQEFWKTVRYFFNSDQLNPHGICLLWRPELLWTHVVSDVVIGLAYFSIPLALGFFLYHRRDVRFGWVIWLFVAFIMLCGVTHFMMVWTLWNADYGIEALIKAATAIASIITAVALWPLLPKVIALPSPAALQARIAERDQALAELKQVMADMVEMKEHEARQRFLLDELNHRVKNTLASVQSIAGQTMKNATSVEDFRQTFTPRLMSLSATHNLLSERTWEGASFRALLDETLAPYGRPYEVDGPDLALNPNMAVTLGMGLHELATNALKYGAWAGGGAVTVEVSTDADDAISIVWTERGGPPVRAPERKGFGSRLLERGLASELHGAVTVEYRPEGLVCTIRARPSERMRLSETEAGAAGA
jgi:two-component sensor histidine kinase